MPSLHAIIRPANQHDKMQKCVLRTKVSDTKSFLIRSLQHGIGQGKIGPVIKWLVRFPDPLWSWGTWLGIDPQARATRVPIACPSVPSHSIPRRSESPDVAQLDDLKCCVRGSGIEVFRVFPLPLDLSAHQTQVTICLSKLETLCRDVKGCHAVGRVFNETIQVFKAQAQPLLYTFVKCVWERIYSIHTVAPGERKERRSCEKVRCRCEAAEQDDRVERARASHLKPSAPNKHDAFALLLVFTFLLIIPIVTYSLPLGYPLL